MRSASIILKIPDNIFGKISASCDLSVKILTCIPMGKESGRSLVKIDTPSEMDGASLKKHIKEAAPLCTVDIVSQRPGEHLASISNNDCEVCGAISETGCFLESASSYGDGRMIWNIVAPSSSALQNLIGRLKEQGCELEIIGIREPSTIKDLTDHQEHLMRLAFDLGYYDIPRRITLEGLEERTGTCKSSLDVALRRAERKLICRHFGLV